MKSRPFCDFPRNEQGLVDNFIGTAFDVVKRVNDNIAELKRLDGVLGEIGELAETKATEAVEAALVPVRVELQGYITEASQVISNGEAQIDAAIAGALVENAATINGIIFDANVAIDNKIDIATDKATEATDASVSAAASALAAAQKADRLISSIDQLKLESPVTAGDFITLKSYFAGGNFGGGPFYWDPTSVETPDDGRVVKVTSLTTGRWIRLFVKRNVYKASDYGIIGNAYIRDAVGHKFYVDAAKTILATDETAKCQKLFDAANSGDPTTGKKFIDLEGRSIGISVAMVVTRPYVAVDAGRLCQFTEAEDVIRFDNGGSAIMMYNSMTAAFSHAYSTVGAGSLVRIAACGVGQFVWDSQYNINEGGFNGWKQYGGCFMMDLSKVWINDTYSSAFYMPGAGGTTQPPVHLGGSTTTVMHRPYVTNVRTKDPAFDIGTGYDGITMVSPAADHITQFGRFKVNGLKIEGIAYSENIRKPIEGAALVDHKFIEIQNASGFSIDGFYASLASDFGASPTGIKTFLDADFIVGEIGMVRGSFPADYSFIRTQGGVVEYRNMLPGTTLNSELSGGRAISKYQSNLKFSGIYPGTGASAIFTIPGLAAASEAHTYLITKTYSYEGKYVSNTWLVSAGNGKAIVTQLQGGPDEPTAFTLTVSADGVVTLTNTGSNILSGPWTAMEVGIF